MTALAEALPPRESVVVSRGWRVAHAFDTSLPGWLVVVPTRHVTSMSDLSVDEAAALGELIRSLSLALTEVTGCTKAYVMFFAEAEGFAHLHVHVVPRMPDFTDEQKGPAVFQLLGVAPEQALSEDARDEVAVRLRTALDELAAP